jgi:radical SAM superfamily enzyme YgiQ (UPF0313 family)
MIRDSLDKYVPHIVGLSGLSADYAFVRDSIAIIRRMAPAVRILLGGGIITYDPDYVFDNLKPDYALLGDAEKSVVMLAHALEKGGPIDSVPNLVYWKNGRPSRTDSKPEIFDLDNLEYPDYSLFGIEKGFRLANQADHFVYAHTRENPRILPITLGRSCPYSCTFCCNHDERPYRVRSVKSALDEMVYFHKKYSFNLLFVYDELFSIKPDRVFEFCDGVSRIKRDFAMDFDWTCALRVDSVDSEMLREMKKTGCIFIGYGIESGSRTILGSMNKKVSLEKIERAVRLTNDAGIGVQGNLILGDFAESPETLCETVSFFEKYKEMMIHYGYVTPYPGSRIFDECMDRGIIIDKGVYYECIGQIGNFTVNMSGMSDQVFEEKTLPLLGSEYKDLIVKQALTCEQSGPCPSDYGAPLEKRRTLFRISVECPYCSFLNRYLMPIGPDGTLSFPQYCGSCHRRYNVDLEQFEPLDFQDRGILEDYSYHGPHVSRALRSYKRHNLIHHRCRIHAVPFDSGPVNPQNPSDMRRPEIIVAENEEDACCKIDQGISG